MAKTKSARRGSARKAGRAAAGARSAKTRGRAGAARTAAASKSARTSTKSAKRSSASAKKKAKKAKAPARASARPASARKAARGAAKSRRASAQQPDTRRAPTLDRDRRSVPDEELVPTPPSSLDLDRRPSAARSGRAELAAKLHQHTSTGPALTGGDIDADWESAETVGDEAPGGDNPTPDQDVVDEIGRALGVEYDDDEELQGGDEIRQRDRKRWELDPASKEEDEE